MNDIRGLDELSRQVLEKGLCAACGACVGRCPYLLRFKGKTVKLDRCTVEQGRCHAYCPMTFFDPEAVSLAVFDQPHDKGHIGHFVEVRASRSTHDQILQVAQGGGTVTTLIIKAIEERLIDAAVLTAAGGDDGFPQGVVGTTAEEVMRCAGSKYVGAHSLAALREALDRGFQAIGVVGLPCEVKSLRKMALYDLKGENLRERIRLVIGLFCNWAFSARDFALFLSERLGKQEIKKLDIPPPPANVLNLVTETGVDSISLDEVRPLIQVACERCDDMTSEFADISVGMYEGRPGWNTLITRTDVGRSLVERAVTEGRLQTDAFPEDNLDHLKTASANKRKRVSGN